MGVCDHALGDKTQAIATLEKFLEEFPESPHEADVKKRRAALKRN